MEEQFPFIFSNEIKYRLRRHAAFWAFWTVFQGFLYAFIPVGPPFNYLSRIPSSMLDSVMFLLSHMFFSYTLMYFVIPAYVVKGKYVATAVWLIVLIFLTAAISASTSMYLINPVRTIILPKKFLFPIRTTVQSSFYLSLLAGLRGGLTIGGLAASIKLMKHWYVEGQRNLKLQKENVESQLQILKAQVHPHFLFNTLNNIYCYTQNTSHIASKLVLGLSDILRYMLYECRQPLVPLVRELDLVEEYIALEKIRYGNKLEIHTDLPVAAHHLLISPLLLLPFVENCFKHGTSNMLEHPWINLHVSIDGRVMTMKLLNSKSGKQRTSHTEGIGIENARRRLELLYPGKHELVIKNEEEIFIVNLRLHLDATTVVKTVEEPSAALAEV